MFGIGLEHCLAVVVFYLARVSFVDFLMHIILKRLKFALQNLNRNERQQMLCTFKV